MMGSVGIRARKGGSHAWRDIAQSLASIFALSPRPRVHLLLFQRYMSLLKRLSEIDNNASVLFFLFEWKFGGFMCKIKPMGSNVWESLEMENLKPWTKLEFYISIHFSIAWANDILSPPLVIRLIFSWNLFWTDASAKSKCQFNSIFYFIASL